MKNSLFFTIVLTLFTSSLFAQTGTISGKILDKGNAEGLIGAAVQIEKTMQGVVTDIEGNFTLTVAPGDYNLLISFISYETVKVAVNVKANQVSTVSVALEESKATLSEVVITDRKSVV